MKSLLEQLIDQMMEQECEKLEKALMQNAVKEKDKGVELSGLLKKEMNLN